jgi:hypothetical protein
MKVRSHSLSRRLLLEASVAAGIGLVAGQPVGGRGRLPDAALRARMEKYWDSNA